MGGREGWGREVRCKGRDGEKVIKKWREGVAEEEDEEEKGNPG